MLLGSLLCFFFVDDEADDEVDDEERFVFVFDFENNDGGSCAIMLVF